MIEGFHLTQANWMINLCENDHNLFARFGRVIGGNKLVISNESILHFYC